MKADVPNQVRALGLCGSIRDVNVHPGAGLVEDAGHLHGPCACRGHGVRGTSVKLGGLAPAGCQVLFTQPQTQFAVRDVQPFVARRGRAAREEEPRGWVGDL